MKRNIIIGSIMVLTIICIIVIYKYFIIEKYTILKNVGNFPICIDNMNEHMTNDKTVDKYDGHLYKQSRPYNFLSQQNMRNQ
jgi:hypothetical protein